MWDTNPTVCLAAPSYQWTLAFFPVFAVASPISVTKGSFLKERIALHVQLKIRFLFLTPRMPVAFID